MAKKSKAKLSKNSSQEFLEVLGVFVDIFLIPAADKKPSFMVGIRVGLLLKAKKLGTLLPSFVSLQ